MIRYSGTLERGQHKKILKICFQGSRNVLTKRAIWEEEKQRTEVFANLAKTEQVKFVSPREMFEK